MAEKGLVGMTLEELESLASDFGEKKFRGKQIYQWIYKGIFTFDEMKNVPKRLIENLKNDYSIGTLEVEDIKTSKTDGTKKYLFKLIDGNFVESVFMKYKYGNTICVSSQSGCRMGCTFCASTIDGLARNLTSGEIIEQILRVEKDTGEKINHIVVMGMGEPFDNYENVKKFIQIVNSKDGLNISMRNITVSTCGIVPKILQFGAQLPQVNLAISLHSVTDEQRSRIMPINRKYKIQELMETCKKHIEMTNRRITFEYALVKGENDRREDIDNLANLLRGVLCHVNLIPLNYVDEIGLVGSNRKDAEKICRQLNDRGIKATVRRELGSDIKGACGQLRLVRK